ncbi:MAG TPA: transcriptional repressor [Bdellovibrionota bacterium]|nr:transcriptional repressor [Bdellovibrionota bacterium]
MEIKKTLPCGRTIDRSEAQHGTSRADRYSTRLSDYEVTHQLNRSSAREMILNVILAMDRHFTALELSKKVQAKNPSVGPATVYRNLPIFVAAGILRESLTNEKGQILYELATVYHHDHIVCVDCHHIIEFHDDSIEVHQETILKRLKFSEVGHRHVMYAKCELLKKRGRKSSKVKSGTEIDSTQRSSLGIDNR